MADIARQQGPPMRPQPAPPGGRGTGGPPSNPPPGGKPPPTRGGGGQPPRPPKGPPTGDLPSPPDNHNAPFRGPPNMALPTLPPVSELPPLPTAPTGGPQSKPPPHHVQHPHHSSAGSMGGPGAHHTFHALPTRQPSSPSGFGGPHDPRRSLTVSQGAAGMQALSSPHSGRAGLSSSGNHDQIKRQSEPRLQKRPSEENLSSHSPSAVPPIRINHPAPPSHSGGGGGGGFTPFPAPSSPSGIPPPPSPPPVTEVEVKEKKKGGKLLAMGGNLRDKIKTKIKEKGDKKGEEGDKKPDVVSPINSPGGAGTGSPGRVGFSNGGLSAPPIMGMPMPMTMTQIPSPTSMEPEEDVRKKRDTSNPSNRLSRAFGRKRNDSVDDGGDPSIQPASPRASMGFTNPLGPGSAIMGMPMPMTPGGGGGGSPSPSRPPRPMPGGGSGVGRGYAIAGMGAPGMMFPPPFGGPAGGYNEGHHDTPSSKETPFERRTKIANELLTTERTYVQSLKDLMSFQEPLMQLANLPDNDIATDDIAKLFGTLPQIIPLNVELLNQLENRMASWHQDSTIGDIFAQMAPFLKMYKDYENGYDTALNTYTNLMSDIAFKTQIDIELTKKPSAQIETILIMPVQRIPRYLMLLQDLLKHTPDKHPDHAPLKKALGLVEQVASSLDQDLQANEQRQRYMELSMATGAVNLLAAHRKLIKEGEVSIIGTFGNLGVDRLNILLFNDILVPFPNSKLSKLGGEKWLNHKRAVIARPENQWPLELVWLTDIEQTEKDKNTFKFQLTGPGRSFIVTTKTLEDKMNWWNCFKEAIETNVNTVQHQVNKQMGAKRVGSYQFKNKIRYSGEWVFGNIEGQGVMEIFGCVYEGNFAKNARKGQGKMTYSTGEVYEGEWIEDLQNGTGTMTYPSGDKYSGSWKAGLRSSKGKMMYANGDIYNGNWDENLPNGQGTLTCATGLTYQGQFAMGQFHGKGTLILPNGMEYNGEWVHGDRDGNGTFTQYLPNDKNIVIFTYTGIWRKNMKSEKGTLTDANGSYTGDWVRDLMEGQGRMEYRDGSVYEGQWKGGVREGFGVFTSGSPYTRVKSYEGEWKDDKKHGRGRLIYTNGNVYEGQFKRDLLHGNGVLLLASGERYEGKWVRDVMLGPCNYTLRQDFSLAFRANTMAQGQEGDSTEAAGPLSFSGSTKDSLLAAGKKVLFPIAPPVAELTFNFTY